MVPACHHRSPVPSIHPSVSGEDAGISRRVSGEGGGLARDASSRAPA